MSEEQAGMGSPRAVTSVNRAVSKTRSPNFPSVTLQVAISKAKEIMRSVGRVPTNDEVIGEAWAQSTRSSTFRLGVAALKHYGLLGEQETGKGTLLKLTPLALDIIEDYPEGSREQREAIQKAALTPKVHGTLFTKYGPMLPSDAEVRRFLLREHEPPFNDNSVGEFITKYKATMAFAGAGVGDKIEEDSPISDVMSVVPSNPGGRAVTPSDPKSSPASAPVGPRMASELVSEPKLPGHLEDTFNLPEGRKVMLRWPEKLDEGSVEELEDWLRLIVRKIRRTNGLSNRPNANSGSDS